eukprot:2487872-Alexandrium_andersonii.AAC.1
MSRESWVAMVVGELSEVALRMHPRRWDEWRGEFVPTRGGVLEQVLYQLGQLRADQTSGSAIA